MTKTIFITGATGFIGRVVAQKAVQQGYICVTPVRGDFTTPEILSREAENADIVLHLAFDRHASKSMQDLIALNIGAIDALATPLVGTNKRLVVTSGTAFVQPDPQGGETFEDSPAVTGLLLLRLQPELHALAYSQKGVYVNVIRLAQVYGRSNKTGFAALLIKMDVESGDSFYVGDGECRLSEVHVDDAADLYLLVAQKAAPGEVYNESGKTSTTYRQLAIAISNLVQVPALPVSLEDAVARCRPVMAVLVSTTNPASNRKAVEKLGWRPQGPDLLTEIRTGTYVGVAEEFKNKKV